MKRAGMVEHALKSSRAGNTESAKRAGYKLLEVRLKSHDMMKVELLKSSGRHKWSGDFSVVPQVSRSCPMSGEQTPAGFSFEGVAELYRIVHLLLLFVTYVKHISHVETTREIVATVLYVLKAGTSANPKATPMDYLDETYKKIMDHGDNHKSRTIKPLINANCNHLQSVSGVLFS